MRKLKKSLALFLVTLISLASMFLYGCSTNGTYYFEEMTILYDDELIVLKAGEEFEGIVLTENIVSLTLSENNTAIMTINALGEKETMLGTWTESGSNVYITFDDDTQIAEKKGKKLIITNSEDDDMLSLTLKK